MPRLFISIEMPPAYVPAFERLKDESLPARWTPPDQYHLTLHFIGQVNEDQVRLLRTELARIDVPGFDLEVSGTAVLPSLRRPNVLVSNTSRPPELKELYHQVGEVLRDCGFETESRPFHPHVTLARFKRPRIHDLETYLERTASFALKPFLVDRFYLYESILRSDGALHRPIEAFPLTNC